MLWYIFSVQYDPTKIMPTFVDWIINYIVNLVSLALSTMVAVICDAIWWLVNDNL